MGFLTSLTSLVSQPTILSVGAGLLTGAVGGSAIVVSGALPLGGQAAAPETIDLLACPDVGPPLGSISEGSRLLVTGRNADGTWYEVYVGLPGIDRAWAPAGALALESGADDLPLADCAAPGEPSPTPGPTPSPASTVEATVALPTPSPSPSPSPSAAPTASPTPGPTTPGATPTPTPKPTKTPAPTKTPSPTPTKAPTPPPPTPTPVPTPTPDTTGPTVSNLQISGNAFNGGGGAYYIYGPSAAATCPYQSANITVSTSDPSGVDHVILYYQPGGAGSPTSLQMTGNAQGTSWARGITAQDGWPDSSGEGDETGRITYWVVAFDELGNQTQLNNSNSYRLYSGLCLF